MLLRIVAAAGTGFLLGASGCSSSSDQVHGVVVNPMTGDFGDSAIEFASDAVAPDPGSPDEGAPMVGLAIGLVPCEGICIGPHDAGADAVDESPTEAGVDASLPCGGGVCGSAPLTPDAGGTEDAGDAALTCGHGGVCGTIVMPPDAGEDGSVDAGVFHGIINGIVINPGH